MVDEEQSLICLAPFGTTWKKGSGATPFTMRGLEIKGAISIPTAPTKTSHSQRFILEFNNNKPFNNN